ncbi:hypothetical protein [Actinoalloteichus caeruleus]|uniref:hypothetical protein n=1 Tax=Actinoalloteichus cyanogriseus TaxID=2893586 RepID=UPI003BB8D6EB
MGVEVGGLQHVQRTVRTAQRLVAHQHVHVPEALHRRPRQLRRTGRAGEVDVPVRDHTTGAGALGHPGDDGAHPTRVRAPRLPFVVREVVVREQVRAQRGQPAGYRVADARPPAHPGDQCGPSEQRERRRSELGRGGETAHGKSS